MKKLFYATALGCVLSLSTMVALAHDAAKEDGLVKASYALPQDSGQEVRDRLREAEDENKTNIEPQIQSDRADLYDILIAPDFNSHAFNKKVKELRGLQAQEKENRDQALAAALSQLSQQDRATFAHAIEVEKHEMKKHSKTAANATNADPIAQ